MHMRSNTKQPCQHSADATAQLLQHVDHETHARTNKTGAGFSDTQIPAKKLQHTISGHEQQWLHNTMLWVTLT
jgi:hypothetical protein